MTETISIGRKMSYMSLNAKKQYQHKMIYLKNDIIHIISAVNYNFQCVYTQYIHKNDIISALTLS